MGFKVSDVSAGVAANLAVFDEDELDNETEHNGPLGLSPAEYFGGAEIGGASGGKHHYDGEDRGHDHAAELSDTGNTVFNYSMRDRMDGDGGTTNKIGYRNFSPVAAEDLDGSERDAARRPTSACISSLSSMRPRSGWPRSRPGCVI